jgi:hypothetical protein
MGERRARLSPEQSYEILEAYAAGERMEVVAKRYGLTTSGARWRLRQDWPVQYAETRQQKLVHAEPENVPRGEDYYGDVRRILELAIAELGGQRPAADLFDFHPEVFREVLKRERRVSRHEANWITLRWRAYRREKVQREREERRAWLAEQYTR